MKERRYKKLLRYFLAVVLIGIVAYNSVYFKKLSEVRAQGPKSFDAATFARNFYDKQLMSKTDSAIDLNMLITMLKNEPEKAFDQYSRALAIGNLRYFLIRGKGIVTRLNDTNAIVSLSGEASPAVKIETEFVYGNAIRDASGLLNLNDFSNTAEFNSISEHVNNIVRAEVLPRFRAEAQRGQRIEFTGAIELNRKYLDLDTVEIVPIQLIVRNEK